MIRTVLQRLAIGSGLLLAANSFPTAVLAHDTGHGSGVMGDMSSAMQGMQAMGDVGHMPMMGGMQMMDGMDHMRMMGGAKLGDMNMMHGSGGYGMFGLSDSQKKDFNRIHHELRKEHWQRMGQIMDEQFTLRDLFDAEKLDSKVIGETYARIFDLKRQMIEAAIDARNRKHALLTEEQHGQLKQMRRRMMGQSGMMQGGMMGQGGMTQGQDTMPSAAPSE